MFADSRPGLPQKDSPLIARKKPTSLGREGQARRFARSEDLTQLCVQVEFCRSLDGRFLQEATRDRVTDHTALLLV